MPGVARHPSLVDTGKAVPERRQLCRVRLICEYIFTMDPSMSNSRYNRLFCRYRTVTDPWTDILLGRGSAYLGRGWLDCLIGISST